MPFENKPGGKDARQSSRSARPAADFDDISDRGLEAADVSAFKESERTFTAADDDDFDDELDAITSRSRYDAEPSRDFSLRDVDVRDTGWSPSSKLPDPPVVNGWRHRWVRLSIRGANDAMNYASKLSDGWQPCSPAEYPDIAARLRVTRDMVDNEIRVGDLVLCRMPEEVARARTRYYQNKTQQQIQSVESRLRGASRKELNIQVERRVSRESDKL